jgi:hypothetical protein
MHIALFTAAVAAAAVFAASPAWAAIELRPGEWQVTETGTEDGKPMKPEVEKECMSADEARDAINLVNEFKKQMTEPSGAQCQGFEAKESGNTVTFMMKCGDPKQFAFDITGVYNFVSPTRYTATMKSDVRMMGRRVTSDKKIDGVWIGECKAGAGKKK